jgi:hypothetical protein
VTLEQPALRELRVQPDSKAPLVHRDQKATPVLQVLRALPVQSDPRVPLAHKDLKAILVQPVQLDPKASPAHKDLKETLVQPALRELWVRLVLRERLEFRESRVLLVQLAQPGRKVLRDLLARLEGLSAGRSFKAPALSWCQLESAG